ncbi:hypothetical protein M885DRAFT_549068 [Pelagophyceae sp. CCMP2097]|nr:hypothetical protein M885DRAFT_549068 [Pelagophyceae sp. CCMP2097]
MDESPSIDELNSLIDSKATTSAGGDADGASRSPRGAAAAAKDEFEAQETSFTAAKASPPKKVDTKEASALAKSRRETNGLRRGKWTVEEEAYANRLIHEFKHGLLPLTDGTTLRTFLSKLLNCDPMRISKKFVGSNCIGKQVFRRRQQDMDRLSPDEIKRSRFELAELERRFLSRVAQSHRSAKAGPPQRQHMMQQSDVGQPRPMLAPWLMPPHEHAGAPPPRATPGAGAAAMAAPYGHGLPYAPRWNEAPYRHHDSRHHEDEEARRHAQFAPQQHAQFAHAQHPYAQQHAQHAQQHAQHLAQHLAHLAHQQHEAHQQHAGDHYPGDYHHAPGAAPQPQHYRGDERRHGLSSCISLMQSSDGLSALDLPSLHSIENLTSLVSPTLGPRNASFSSDGLSHGWPSALRLRLLRDADYKLSSTNLEGLRPRAASLESLGEDAAPDAPGHADDAPLPSAGLASLGAAAPAAPSSASERRRVNDGDEAAAPQHAGDAHVETDGARAPAAGAYRDAGAAAPGPAPRDAAAPPRPDDAPSDPSGAPVASNGAMASNGASSSSTAKRPREASSESMSVRARVESAVLNAHRNSSVDNFLSLVQSGDIPAPDDNLLSLPILQHLMTKPLPRAAHNGHDASAARPEMPAPGSAP